jgi:hypothetical protein
MYDWVLDVELLRMRTGSCGGAESGSTISCDSVVAITLGTTTAAGGAAAALGGAADFAAGLFI